MSKGATGSTQAQALTAPLPFSTKEEAQRWLEQLATVNVRQNLPPEINERVTELRKRISTKDQSFEDLRPELESLHNQLVPVGDQLLQQVLQVGIPGSFLRDPRVDMLVDKMRELDITRKVKVEITEDLEHANKRLRSHIEDNYEKIEKLKKDVGDRDQIIDELKKKVAELTEEKAKLERKVKDLEGEIEGLKSDVGRLEKTVAERDQKIEKLLELHGERIQKLTDEKTETDTKIEQLEEKNQSLESQNEAQEVRFKKLEDRNKELEKGIQSITTVGETMKIMIRAIYEYVHPALPHRSEKYSYAVSEIDDHMNKYKNDTKEKRDAEERWAKLQTELLWNMDAEFIIDQLIKKRNERRHPLRKLGEEQKPVDMSQFRVALEQMKEANDITDDEENFVYDIFSKCKRKFKI